MIIKKPKHTDGFEPRTRGTFLLPDNVDGLICNHYIRENLVKRNKAFYEGTRSFCVIVVVISWILLNEGEREEEVIERPMR